MKRCLLVSALLPFLSLGARADYLVIKVDVNRAFASGDTKQGGVLSMTPRKDGKGGPGFVPGGGVTGPGGGFSLPPRGGFRPGAYPIPPAQAQPQPVQPKPEPVPGKLDPKTGGKNTFDNLPPRWAYAYLELRGQTRAVYTKDKVTHIAIEHPWGKQCVVPIETVAYIDYVNGSFQKDTTAREFAKRSKSLAKEGRTPVKLFRLAQWALAHGLMKEFHATMDLLQKANDIPADIKTALSAYSQVYEKLKKYPADTDPAQADVIVDLQGSNYQAVPAPHYLLFTNMSSPTGDAVKHRLTLLEDAYEKFFYWFALHSPGAGPPLPAYKQMVVLVGTAKEFLNKHAEWGSVPLVGDAFLPRRDNVLVMSAEPLDETYGLLRKNNQSYCQNLRIGSEELLSGGVWKRQEAQQNDLNVAMLQTLILVQKATEQETERATISHEATRQLLFAVGFLPRNVAMPEWIQYGVSSFFETPPGAFFPGLGIPSWSNLVNFKHHRRMKNLGAPKEVLYQVVTDGYFRKAKASAALLLPNQEKKPVLEERAEKDREIAQSTAWALVYYLARENKLRALLRFSDELKRMPRDLDLNEQLLRGCFLRAFELTDTQMQSFADAWFAEMQNYVLDMPPAYEDSLLQAREETTVSKTASGPSTK